MKYYCRRGRNQVARQKSEKKELFDTVQNVADVTSLLFGFSCELLKSRKEAQLFQALRIEVFPNRTNFHTILEGPTIILA